jgi:hypothetical protein
MPPTFESLPAELRVKIYKLCFDGAILAIGDDNDPDQIDLSRSSACGQITRACKSIYAEAMPVLYGQTTLIQHGMSKGPFHYGILPACRKLIRRLHILNEDDVEFPRQRISLTMRALLRYKSLQCLKVDIGFIYPYGLWDRDDPGPHPLPGPDDKSILARVEQDIIENTGWRDYDSPIHRADLKRVIESNRRNFKIEIVLEHWVMVNSDMWDIQVSCR